MTTEIFSLWGWQSGQITLRQGRYHISAVIGEWGIWYVGTDLKQLEQAFNRACRRMVLRRLLPFLALPPARLSVETLNLRQHSQSLHGALATD